MQPYLPLSSGALRFSLALLAIIAVGLTGCAGSSASQRGRLSEAMEKASDDYRGDRSIETSPVAYSAAEDAESSSRLQSDSTGSSPVADLAHLLFSIFSSSSDTTPSSDSSALRRVWLSLGAGSGILREAESHALHNLYAQLGIDLSQQTQLHLTIEAAWAPVTTSERLARSLDGPLALLHCGGRLEVNLTDPGTMPMLYIATGLGLTQASWEYRDPVIVGSESIADDNLTGLELNAGFGVEVIETERLRLGLEAIPGAIFWTGATSQGLANDFFPTFISLKARALLSVRL